MKKFMITATALALLFPIAAFAQNRDAPMDQGQGQGSQKAPAPQKTTQAKPATQSHKFTKGQRFDRAKAENYRRVTYTENSRLSRPPSGYTWVRSGNDALLVRLSNNVISQIVIDVF